MPPVETIGYFFGTFNPIHYGHLIFAEYARKQMGLSRIIWIPSANPPHKQSNDDIVSIEHRLNMVKLACQNNTYFIVSDIETKRSGPSYTIDTLRQLIPGFDNRQERVYVLMGQDAVASLATWYQADKLIQKVYLLQAPRDQAQMVRYITINATSHSLSTELIDMPDIGISSSLIRHCCNINKDIRYLTPASVIDYIQWNQLYQNTISK